VSHKLLKVAESALLFCCEQVAVVGKKLMRLSLCLYEPDVCTADDVRVNTLFCEPLVCCQRVLACLLCDLML